MSTFPIKSFFIKIAKYILSNEEDWIIYARRRYVNSVMVKKKHNVAQLSEKELDEITRFWHKFHKQATSLFSMQQYAVYKNAISGGILKMYIPDDFYYCYADTYFTNYHISIKLDNKNIYDILFNGFNMPRNGS